MSTPWRCRVVCSLLSVVLVLSPVKSQDVGSFLAGLLGAADVPAQSNNSSQNTLPCPGECVHIITSFLCNRVIEQFDCGSSYLSCCVSSDFNFGTVVETSAPLPEDSSTESSTQYEVFLVSTDPSHEFTTNHIQDSSSSSPPPIRLLPTTPKTTQSPTTIGKLKPCEGICVENIFVRYCTRTIPGFCAKGSTCCASNTDEDEGSMETTTISIPISWSTNSYDDRSQTPHHQPYETIQTSTTTLPGPMCPGSCVAPLFSLLCDSVNSNFYCPNDGRCCISSDEQEPEPTTTTPAVPLLNMACPGACVPMFLRGMCNRPSELMLQSDCDQDFVCCYQPDVKDHQHVESPQIPLIRPGNQPQSSYPNPPLKPQGNLPPIRQQYPLQMGYPQRPQSVYNPKPVPPVIISNSHAPPNSNQVIYETNHPGYISVPLSHGNPNYGKPYPQNGNGVYEQPPRPLPNNSSGDSARFPASTQEAPQRDHVISLTQDKRRPNISNFPPEAQSFDQMFIPPEIHHESSRLVPPGMVQVPKPVDSSNPKRQRIPQSDQVVSASIGIGSGNLRPVDQTQKIPIMTDLSPIRPINSDRINKPPHPERFRPLPSHNLNPPGKQNSTLVIPDPGRPSGPSDDSYDTSVAESLKSSHAFIPVQESFRPIQTQHRPPPRPPQTPRPALPPPTPSTPRPLQMKPVRPLTPVAALSPDTEETMVVLSTAINESSADEPPKKAMPECPGSCIGSFLRFTCFGNSAIYNGFRCEPDGTLCCTSVEFIEKYEEHLKSGGPLVLVKPDDHKGEMASTAVRRPGMYVCGIKGNQRRKTGRVVGGKTSAPGEWCWQVALINSKNQYLCGGALIGSRWVLTAAHCVTALVRNGDAIFARVGDYDLSSQYGTPGAQTQKVSTSYIHHNHNGQTLDNDIALLRLENPVQLQESVCLSCLPARGAESRPGKRCTVTGYGYMSESGPIALKIREAVLPIVEEKLCTEQINKVTEKRFLLPTGSFCAGGETGNDACQGDGGGPLTCENEGYHELTGLVSWGFGCGKENVPGVYVKVSSYIGWINQIISVNN